jgi:Flp pilus assembly protein TadD
MLLTIPLRSLALRLAFLSASAAALLALGYFLTRAAIGDGYATFIERQPGLDTATRLEGADLAVRYGSRDPLIHYQRGGVYLAAAADEQLEARLSTAVAELRTAARMSPEDYRIWIALGRALDRRGQQAEARAAFERAAQLAPRHFDPHWALGNHLLRAGAREAAFAELRVALANRPSALPLVFDYAWRAFNGDGRAMASALSPPAEARAQLAELLIARDRVEDALAVWREAGRARPAEAYRIAQALIGKQRFGPAYEVWRSAGGNLPSPDEGSLLANGSFEREIAVNATTPFLTWRISPSAGTVVSLDRQEHQAGAYSLRVSFDVRGGADLIIAAQTVAVAPATTYRLSAAGGRQSRVARLRR